MNKPPANLQAFIKYCEWRTIDNHNINTIPGTDQKLTRQALRTLVNLLTDIEYECRVVVMNAQQLRDVLEVDISHDKIPLSVETIYYAGRDLVVLPDGTLPNDGYGYGDG